MQVLSGLNVASRSSDKIWTCIIVYKSNDYHLKAINEGTVLAIQSIFLGKAYCKACYTEVCKSEALAFFIDMIIPTIMYYHT